MKRYPLTSQQLAQYYCDAQDAVARSHHLWKTVNSMIAEVMQEALQKGQSRQEVCSRLMKLAGPKRRGEAVSTANFRSAARQIANGAERLTLI